MNRPLVLSCLFALSVVLPTAAAERKPWPRRPGVVLAQLKNAEAQAATALSPSGSIVALTAAALGSLAGSSEEDLAEALIKTGRYAFAEPDYRLSAAQMPDDPQFRSQWFHAAIRSPEAWDLATGAASVTVAVLDTGIDSGHPDLAPNLQLPGYNVPRANTDTSPVAPHGTWVAGIIGAVGNNGRGGAGLNWSVRLLPVRITDSPDTGAWCSDMARGIEWAADHGARVINLSYTTLGCPATIHAASRYAFDRGALVFVAAGNEAVDLSSYYPTVHQQILVGATDSSNRRTAFSNFGGSVDLYAPGLRMYTTSTGVEYVERNGTSFASPLAAGLAALIWSRHPALPAATVRDVLFATARAGPGLQGNGRIDAADAMALAADWAAHGPSPWPPKKGVDGGVGDLVADTVAATASVRVFPNPWRADRHAQPLMTFDALAGDATVQIFTAAGHLVRTLPSRGNAAQWDLTADDGQRVASGLYVFRVASAQGSSARGKIAVIR